MPQIHAGNCKKPRDSVCCLKSMRNIINEWYSKEFRRKFESTKGNRATENSPVNGCKRINFKGYNFVIPGCLVVQ